MEEKNKKFFLNEVKSSFILKRIFDNLERNRFLNIIKYSKEFQKKIRNKYQRL